jgi:hypothetical protein
MIRFQMAPIGMQLPSPQVLLALRCCNRLDNSTILYCSTRWPVLFCNSRHPTYVLQFFWRFLKLVTCCKQQHSFGLHGSHGSASSLQPHPAHTQLASPSAVSTFPTPSSASLMVCCSLVSCVVPCVKGARTLSLCLRLPWLHSAHELDRSPVLGRRNGILGFLLKIVSVVQHQSDVLQSGEVSEVCACAELSVNPFFLRLIRRGALWYRYVSLVYVCVAAAFVWCLPGSHCVCSMMSSGCSCCLSGQQSDAAPKAPELKLPVPSFGLKLPSSKTLSSEGSAVSPLLGSGHSFTEEQRLAPIFMVICQGLQSWLLFKPVVAFRT